MRLELTDYQDLAVADVASAIDEGVERFESHEKLTAISLSAPTGAGKTVIATAVIERLWFGDQVAEPRPDVTVLWVTDDPNLNQQTRRKMLVTSELIQPSTVEVVGTSLDQRTLDSGKVYFVHIQQLGKGATRYNEVGDGRQYGLWTIIGNTIADRGRDFLLVIDEAHKGTRRANGGTITAQLTDGAGGKFPAAPIVLGISATPKRFNEAITDTGQRTLEPVGVSPEAVRESGLLKDKILIKHPTESQPGDFTLLELAVQDLKQIDALWTHYSTSQHEPPVRPALVLQVRPAIGDADLVAILDTLASTWNVMSGKAIGHSLQGHGTLNLGTHSVRYIAPQDIQDDPHLRAVIFKEALTTGWDCPRAEVMLSLRTAKDYTYIAQLIGRMVRTPLARRITTDDVLNTVALYLPYYREDEVKKVVAGIESDDSQLSSKVEINPVVCPRSATIPPATWPLLEDVPTYTRPAKNHRHETARLNGLATLLVGAELQSDAMEVAKTHLVDTLKRESKRLGLWLDQKVSDLAQLDYQIQTVDLATMQTESVQAQVIVNARNINDAFRRACRVLGDAAAKWYWDSLCDDGAEPDSAKIRVAALAEDPVTVQAVEVAAHGLVDAWRKKHNPAINQLNESDRDRFYNIWRQAKTAQQVTLIMPTQVTAADKVVTEKEGGKATEDVPRWTKHVYSNGKGSYPARLSGWEEDVLAAELSKKSLRGWYRNPTGGRSALAVPYDQSGKSRTLYPDFIFLHEVEGDLVLDIIDPHRPNEADTGPKWAGLAQYAHAHGHQFRRISAVIKAANDELLALDLKNPDVMARMHEAHNETDIRSAFDELGGLY